MILHWSAYDDDDFAVWTFFEGLDGFTVWTDYCHWRSGSGW